MSQTTEITWTNGSNVNPVPVYLGFEPVSVIVNDLTAGTQTIWNRGMPQGSFISTFASSPSITTSNGYTSYDRTNPLGAGIPITGLYELGTPNYFEFNTNGIGYMFPLEVGATIKVVGCLGNLVPSMPNRVNPIDGYYTIQSVNLSAGQLNINQNLTNTQAYVAGGLIIPYLDPQGRRYDLPLNSPICGLIGTGMAGASGSNMQAIFQSAVAVV